MVPEPPKNLPAKKRESWTTVDKDFFFEALFEVRVDTLRTFECALRCTVLCFFNVF